MINNIRDFLGYISGYKQLCEQYHELYQDAADDLVQCSHEKAELNEVIIQLKLLAARPLPPKVTYIRNKDSAWIQQVIDNLGVGIIRLPLDGKYRLTNESNFVEIIAWDWLDSEKYQSEIFDCENFAIAFKSHVDYYFGLNQVGIVIDYKSGHAYNLVIYPDGDVSVLEPQGDALYVWEKRPAPFYTMEGAIVLI